MELNLADKKILLIEDNPFMRKSIRSMLQTLEAEHIVEASDANKALNILRKRQFDIILADYNLGKGKNSLQLLEEIRLLKLLNFHTIFIIISSEQSPQMVLGAMDSKPDEYLTKPFNTHQLAIRLKRNFLLKQLLRPIDQAISENNYAAAIAHCERLLQQNEQKNHLILLRKRAELALDINDLAQAKTIYQKILQQRDLPWARLGLAIISYRSGQIDEAINRFQAIIAQTPLFIECYDWLSQIYLAQNQLDKAEEILNQAVELSPNSILRQKKLGLTAYRNQHIDRAEKALKNVLALSKNSVHKSSQDYASLAKVYQESKKTPEAFALLQDLRQEFLYDAEAELRALLLESEIHLSQNETKPAREKLDQALKIHKNSTEKLARDALLELAKVCFLHHKNKLANAILKGLVQDHFEDQDFIEEINRMHEKIGQKNQLDKIIQALKKELLELNNQGVTLFEQGNITQALTLFENAFKKMPRNKTILLNILKIQLHQFKSDHSPKLTRQINGLLHQAKKSGIAKEKIGELQMEFNQLQASDAPQKAHVH